MGSDFMGNCIAEFAQGKGNVCLYDLITDGKREPSNGADSIMDECARQAGMMLMEGSPNPEAEKRLRRLVAVMLELKSLGLID